MKTKTMKLPELSETSEPENQSSAADENTPTSTAPPPVQPLPPQGSPYQSRRSGVTALNSDRLPPTAKVMPQISITDEDGADVIPTSPPSSGDQSTPLALPQAFLRKLGLSVEDDEKDVTVDQLSEKEVESKFVTLSLAFKTDKLTLDQRVIVQERARDIAEQNVDVELQGIRDAIEVTLGDLSCDPEIRDVMEKIKLHIDVLEISAAKVSSRAEVFGAVQQERRLCKAMEVMVLYTENLRRIRAKEESEVQEARKVLSERSGAGYSLDVDSGGPSRRSMSVCGFAPGVRTMRRRSEVALPRILGGTGSPSPAQENDLFHTERLFASNSFGTINQGSEDEEGPKARFQSAVASTSIQHAVTATIRQASLDKQRSISVYAGSPFAPNSSVLGVSGEGRGGGGGGGGSDAPIGRPPGLRKTSPQPSLAVTPEDEGDSSVHVSHPYVSMELTRDLKSLCFALKLMELFQIFPSLANAAVAKAIRVRTSTVELPSYCKVAPRYLNLCTNSRGLSSMVMEASLTLSLLTMTLDFSELTSIPKALEEATNLSVRTCNSACYPNIRSMSSAKRRLHIGLPPMEIVGLCWCRVSCIIRSRNILKSTGERRQPCLTPAVVLKKFPMVLFRILNRGSKKAKA
ncbi:lymphoid-restricted membrane protein [Elysia marginata]|uniref:Lymphoid-restricted membrane protein n=1 Tax=Elysia marginata TaxID=1093978 RepID=A0AAV4ELF9_9GAST|nr:lymphoid-restricted membrane protein [Elysia marginata]